MTAFDSTYMCLNEAVSSTCYVCEWLQLDLHATFVNEAVGGAHYVCKWLQLVLHTMFVNDYSWIYMLCVNDCSWLYIPCVWMKQLALHAKSVNDCSWFYMLCVWMTAVGSIHYVCEWLLLVLHTMCVNECSWIYMLCVWMKQLANARLVGLPNANGFNHGLAMELKSREKYLASKLSCYCNTLHRCTNN